jgi:hypothetical protein
MRQNIPCVAFWQFKAHGWGTFPKCRAGVDGLGTFSKGGARIDYHLILDFGNAHTLGPIQSNPNYIQYYSQGDDFLLTFLWTQNPNVLDYLPLEKMQGKRKEKKIARSLFGTYGRSLTLAWSIS